MSVLTTPELLEKVLAHLPTRSLLLAQRVCRDWRSLIRASPTLQERLFYALPPPSSSSPLRPPLQNELLRAVFPAWFGGDRWRRLSAFPPPTAALLRRGASWRSMLAVDRPVTLLKAEGMMDRGDDFGELARLRPAPARVPLTMGMLYDLAQGFLGTGEAAFTVKWELERLGSAAGEGEGEEEEAGPTVTVVLLEMQCFGASARDGRQFTYRCEEARDWYGEGMWVLVKKIYGSGELCTAVPGWTAL